MRLSVLIKMDLEKRPWSSKSPPTKGPKRLCKFFVLAVILPMICLCVPLYMRFQALKPQVFTLSPSDMKLLNQVIGRRSYIYVGLYLTLFSLKIFIYILHKFVHFYFRIAEYPQYGVRGRNSGWMDRSMHIYYQLNQD